MAWVKASMPVAAVSPLGILDIISGSITAITGMSCTSTHTNFLFFSTSVMKMCIRDRAYILEMLREDNGYQVRPSTAYDPGYGMDVELLFSFLEATQKDALTRLERLYGDKTRQTILNYIHNEVNKKKRGLLDVLKHGVEFDMSLIHI